MYSRPPLTATGGGALVAGGVTFNVLAAPGAGFRYRIVAAFIGISRTAGAAIVDATFIDSISASVPIRAPGAMQLTGVPGYYIPIVEPGVIFTENAIVQVSFASTVAAGSGVVLLHYFIDTIS